MKVKASTVPCGPTSRACAVESNTRPELEPAETQRRSGDSRSSNSSNSSQHTHARTQKQLKMGKTYQVMVHGVRGEKMIIDLCNTDEQFRSMTVLQLKEKIAERIPESAGKVSTLL